MHEIIPAARIIALLINPNNANAERDAAIVQEAARAVGRQILVTRAVNETDFETVFATFVREGAGALLVNSDVFFTGQRDRIVALAARHAIPPSGAASDCVGAETHWKAVEQINTLEAYLDHLKHFPDCAFATIAPTRQAGGAVT